jgi:hypothetical protein
MCVYALAPEPTRWIVYCPEPSEVGLGFGPANSLFGSFPHSSTFFSPIHIHLPLAFLWPTSTLSICGQWDKYRIKQACPPAAIIRTNGSSLLHNPSSSNNTVVSQSHPISSLVEPLVLPTPIELRASKYRHVGCREKQSSQRRRRPAPETTQCLDPLSLRQAPRTAPAPRGPAETDTGGGVQDHFGTMARRDGRCACDVRAARRDGQGGARAPLPELSLRADEEGRQGSHSRGKTPGEGAGTCWS